VHHDLFVRLGFTDELFTELTGMLDEYTKAVEEAAVGRQRHVAASADLEKVVAEIVSLVQRIHSFNQHRFRGDADALAAGDTAWNVFGPVRSQVTKPVPDPTPEGAPPAKRKQVDTAARKGTATR